MVQDQIRYDVLIQNALRNVVRKVMMEVSTNGLPGDHYFFITFSTTAKGVKISPQLKANYPEKMTIILQNQFWDLKVSDHAFEVKLSFNMVPEKLVIPFYTILTFVDPSVAFKVDFDIEKTNENSEETLNDSSSTIISAEIDENNLSDSLPFMASETKKLQEKLAERLDPLAQTLTPPTDNNIVSLDAFRRNKPSNQE